MKTHQDLFDLWQHVLLFVMTYHPTNSFRIGIAAHAERIGAAIRHDTGAVSLMHLDAWRDRPLGTWTLDYLRSFRRWLEGEHVVFQHWFMLREPPARSPENQ